MNLLFLDTETTGKDETARLVQLAYKLYGVKKCEVRYVRPPIPISFEAMAVHHITNEAVANLPMLEGIPEVKAEIQDLLTKNIMVAHNAPFDAEILRREGLEPNQIIDTLKVAQNLFDLTMYKLQFLRYNFGLEITQVRAHDAEGDVEVLEALFNYLFHYMARQKPELDESEIIGTMVKWTAEPLLLRRMGFGKHKGKEFKDLPKDYLEWLNKQPDIDADLKYTIEHYLKTKCLTLTTGQNLETKK